MVSRQPLLVSTWSFDMASLVLVIMTRHFCVARVNLADQKWRETTAVM